MKQPVLKLSRVIGVALCVVVFAEQGVAQDWPHWRGPSFDGATSVTGLPARFGPKENVAWVTAMTGPAASTPIVVGKRIFLTSTDKEGGRLLAVCVDRESGALLWERDAGSGYGAGEDAASKIAGGPRSNYASPSPCTDDERVFFFFGNGDLVAYDYEGSELWRRNLQQSYGDFAFQWTFSASPTVWGGKVWLPLLQRDVPVARRGGPGAQRGEGEARDKPRSFVLAFDALSGETKVEVERPSPARVESREAYTTILPWSSKRGTDLLCLGGDVLTGHDPESGRELWRWGTWNPGHREQWWRIVPSVVLAGDIALVCAPKRAPVYALSLSDIAAKAIAREATTQEAVAGAAGADGAASDAGLLWKSEGRPNEVSSDVPTPAYHDGYFFVLNDDRATLSKVAAKDGAIQWTTALTKDYLWRSSPTIADGRVFVMDHNGNVVVVSEDSGDILHEVAFGREDDDKIRSSIVAAHGALFLRTNDKLWCIAKR